MIKDILSLKLAFAIKQSTTILLAYAWFVKSLGHLSDQQLDDSNV